MAPFVGLTGFMGSGKSSVGPEVARRLDCAFIDLDEEIVRREGRGIAAMFAEKGEAAFRQEEVETLRDVLAQRRPEGGLVLALGGGTLESPAAQELLRDLGGLVLLDVDVAEAWRRVQNGERPLAQQREAFEALFQRRRGVYHTAAAWVLPVGNESAVQIAEDIVTLVKRSGGRWKTLWGRRLGGTERSSLIIGGEGALDSLQPWASAAAETGSRLFVITDQNVIRLWGEQIIGLLAVESKERVLAVEPGEPSKSAAVLGRCWEWLAKNGARRDDVIVGLGGGVVGDLAGFVAATYQRGVSLWQIPTSLLAQVDSSVGGKTAINLAAGKNLVGAFYQPDLVFSDPRVLRTLPTEEYVNGLGEIIKHALLMSEAAFEQLEASADGVQRRDPALIAELVKMSVSYKAGVVCADEREAGRRAVLNLGHTVGHALEVIEGYGALSHGQAVALGLLVALAVSERLLRLESEVRARTKDLMARVGLATTIVMPAVDDVFAAMGRDKKVRADSMGFVGLKAPGEPVWGLDVPRDDLEAALEVIRR